MILETIQQIAEALDKVFPVNLFVVNRDGKIRWANQRMLQCSGISDLKSIKGKDARLFGETEWEHTKKVIESNKNDISYESVQHKNYITMKIPFSQGGFHGAAGLSIDITALEQAKHAKEEFMMNMAHDLRTPLTGIIGLSNLQAVFGTSAREQEYGQMIQHASEQLLELLNAVLTVLNTEHTADHIEADCIHLPQLAEELQALMKPSVETKGLQFQVKLEPNLPAITSDRLKLKQLLLNLLSNSVKFTQQGEINLEIKLLSLENDQAKIEMRVTDTGIGIAKDNLDKLFDRFYRGHPSYAAEYSGYGIGLYLVKKMLELLDGEIKVTSEEGKGSCFTVTFNFPLANEEGDKTLNAALQTAKVRGLCSAVTI
jgi:signal transduction histidine kinase